LFLRHIFIHIFQQIPKILERVLMSNVQFQQVQVQRFREHLLLREQLMRDLDKAERERLKAEEEVQRAAAAPDKRLPRPAGVPMIFAKGVEELV
jgi:hypothetical protein